MEADQIPTAEPGAIEPGTDPAASGVLAKAGEVLDGAADVGDAIVLVVVVGEIIGAILPG